MPSVALTGSDTVTMIASTGPRNISDFGSGDVVKLTFPNDLLSLKVGKNGNIIYGHNELGKIVEVEMRVLVGSADDKWLNSRMQEQKNGLADFILLKGNFVKRSGNGAGSSSASTYDLVGGAFKRNVDTKSNSEGDTTQAEAVYTMLFSSERSIQ